MKRFFLDLLKTNYTFEIYPTTTNLPKKWDILANTNVFLSSTYFSILEKSAPKNMRCLYIGIYDNDIIIGVAIAQLINLSNVNSFGANKSCIKSMIRDFVFKKFSSNVLFIGNNMLTGQNSFLFSDNSNKIEGIKALHQAAKQIISNLKKEGTSVHLHSYKDFNEKDILNFDNKTFSKYLKFSTQPNMVFDVQQTWNIEADYVDSLSKKYRDHYKRARKKSENITKKQLSLSEIIENKDLINQLYLNVTKNAPFNSFYLADNHFEVLKATLNEKFLFYGYFYEEKLIGFNTMIVNGNILDTYFLGYDDNHQKDKMLYLNMLYDMIGYAIVKKFHTLIFSRTALEIKSSVGAKPVQMFGYMKHSNGLINLFMDKIFNYFEPEVIWQERNPFK